MPLRLEVFSAVHIEQARRLNARLRKAQVDPGFLLPENPPQTPADVRPFREPGSDFAKRHFLALDGEEVRGGFLLQEQPCEIAGETQWCANIQMPISEGLVERKYSYVAAQMVYLLLRDQPFVFAVGMGSVEARFARLLSALKWRVALAPFRFFVIRPARFLREIQPLRLTPSRRLAADLMALSGLGTAGILGLQKARTQAATPLIAEPISRWDDESTSLWRAYRNHCSFGAIRDAVTLPFFLNLEEPRLLAYRLRGRDHITRGWVALQFAHMRGSKYFGSLRVATLLDAVCEWGFERATVQAARDCAINHSAELLVTNQSHQLWLAAFETSGFWNGPSNYVIATSPELTKRIAAVDRGFVNVHISRADGDGRLNL